MVVMNLRICNSCKKEKPLTDFYTHKNKRYKVYYTCKDCTKQITGAYLKTPRGKYILYRKDARRKGLKFELTFEEFVTFWQKPCVYCGRQIETIGLDRVNNDYGYIVKNLVACCGTCNKMKLTFTSEQFLQNCQLVCEHERKLHGRT